MKHIKQYVTRSDSVESPETGFFNAGQKMQFWEIVCGCIAYVITGRHHVVPGDLRAHPGGDLVCDP